MRNGHAIACNAQKSFLQMIHWITDLPIDCPWTKRNEFISDRL